MLLLSDKLCIHKLKQTTAHCLLVVLLDLLKTHTLKIAITFADFSIAGSTSVYAGGRWKMFAGSLIEN